MTIEQLAYTLTVVVAGLDEDPHDDLAPAELSPANVTRLREAHAAAHQLRRRGSLVTDSLNWIDIQKAAMKEAMRRAGGHPHAAAAMLGISHVTLWKWRKSHGIS